MITFKPCVGNATEQKEQNFRLNKTSISFVQAGSLAEEPALSHPRKIKTKIPIKNLKPN